MPIVVPKALPAHDILIKENVFVINESRAMAQDIRPIRIAIVNLMPNKEVTETQLIRMLANTPLQVEIKLLHMGSHEAVNTEQEHLESFYSTLDEIKHQKFDGMIITGAPVETLDFKEVDYWKELSELMEYTKSNVYSTLHICWGAQAGLYYHYGIDKYSLSKKLFGVFPHVIKQRNCELLRGFDDEFYVPHSRYAQIKVEQLNNVDEVLVLADSEDAGPNIIATPNLRRIFIQGHMEYEKETLKLEYERDLKKGLDIEIPKNYFKNDNPEEDIIVKWRGHANLFYSNWLNFIYQSTPYDMKDLEVY